MLEPSGVLRYATKSLPFELDFNLTARLLFFFSPSSSVEESIQPVITARRDLYDLTLPSHLPAQKPLFPPGVWAPAAIFNLHTKH